MMNWQVWECEIVRGAVHEEIEASDAHALWL